MGLPLFLLKQKGPVGWDEYDGFIVAASSSDQAREIAMQGYGGEGKDVWDSPKKSTCVMLASDSIVKRPRIVLESFNAG